MKFLLYVHLPFIIMDNYLFVTFHCKGSKTRSSNVRNIFFYLIKVPRTFESADQKRCAFRH